MEPTRRGQIVNFKKSVKNELHARSYVILSFEEKGEDSMVEMQAGGTGLPFPIIKTALARDLIVDEGQTLELEYYLKYGNNDLF